MEVCRKHQVKTFMGTQRGEFTLIPKDYFYIDLLVEKLSKRTVSYHRSDRGQIRGG